MSRYDDKPINHFTWGKFIVRGKTHSKEYGKGKDIFLVGDKVKEWKERKGHDLKKKMVDLVFDYDIDVLIIGNGVNGALKVSEKTKNYIKENGVNEVIVEKTPDACKLYNKYYLEEKKVGLLAHGTC